MAGNAEEKMTWRLGSPYATETKRFKLYSLGPDDLTEDYVSWWNDPEIQEGFGFPPRGWTMTNAQNNLQNFDNRHNFHLGIYPKDENRLIGFLTLTFDHTHKVSLANFCLGDRGFWGTGVLIELKVHLMDFMFNTMGMEKLETKIFGRNLPSIFNSRAMGFVSEGVLRQHQPRPGGGRNDVYLFGLLKSEWEALVKEGKGPYAS